MRTLHRFTLQEKVDFLRQPSSYSSRAPAVGAIETHFAWVFLTPRYAYKLKKPVRHVAMDYRSLAARRRGCLDEVRLNRRLAPQVYLCVVPLRSRNGSLCLGGEGRIEDWLVKMHRLAPSCLLDRTLRHRALRNPELERIVARLAAFFAGARRSPVSGEAYVRRLRREVAVNRNELTRAGSQIRQSLVQDVTRTQRAFIERAGPLLAERGARVVEGHGDLRAEHVCLGPRPCVIDCLEFSRDLRLFDPLEEVAFLALEIERLGHRALAAQLLQRFQSASDNQGADPLVGFYLSHRAATRAKLAVWHLGDPQFPDPRPWIGRANSYLRDALRHGRRALRLLRHPAPGGAGIRFPDRRRTGSDAGARAEQR